MKRMMVTVAAAVAWLGRACRNSAPASQ